MAGNSTTTISHFIERILVIDHSPTMAQLYQRILIEGSNADVDCAVGRRQGLDLLYRAVLDSRPYDLVVLDLHLSAQESLQLLKEVKQDVAVREIPFIVSGFSRAKDLMIAAARMGFRNVVLCPFGTEMLKRAVNKAINPPAA